MSTGFVLNIPQEMINRLEDADKKIEKLAKTSEDAQTRIVSAFKSINTHGIDAFINKLTEAHNAIQGLSNVELNIKSGGFESVKRGVAEVSDELRELNELQEQHRQKSEEIAAVEKREEEHAANKAKLQKEYFEAKARYEAEAAKLDSMPLPWGGESFEDTIKRYEKALKRVQKAAQEASNPQELEGLNREIEFRQEELKILKSIRSEEDAIERTRQRYRTQRQSVVDPLYQQYMQAGQAWEDYEAIRKQEKGLYQLKNELSVIEAKIEKAEAAYGRSVLLGGKQQGVVQTPVSAVSEQSTVAIDAINKLIDAINKLHSLQRKSSPSSSSRASTITDAERERKAYVDTYKMYERMFDQIERKRVAKEKAAQKEAKAAEASAEREARAAEKAAERERKAYEKAYKERAKQYQEANRKQLSTYSGAMEFSQNAHTINRMVQSIKYLQSARDALSNTDSQYTQKVKALNDEIKRQNAEINKVRNGAKELQKEHRSLMDISGQLARRLALVFSVSQISGYVKKMIEVRGEFELQQRSLQAILQNKDQANRIWQQTVDLAVRSPFRVKELVSYTKQLAAYRLESDKLFDTTKMLADVSAGLGVDMQRLILAYGQVRSAEFLRGTELRQLTEAGVPVLEHLSQHFSELEGRAVSVGDVFDRISKRMVTFADVEGVFKKITSEGGTFYRMQEIQAETLQGQISNLKDSVDIMLNDIGKAHEGTLKNSVAFVRSLIVNWEVFADIIKTAAASFALYKLNLLAVTKAQIANNIALQSLVKNEIIQRGVIKGLIYAFKSLAPQIDRANASMAKFGKANLWIIALSAVISSIIAIVRHTKQMNEALAEQDKAFNNSIVSLKKLEKQYKEASKGDDSFATKMKSLRELSTRLEDRNLKLSVSIEDVNTENIDKIFEENTKILEVAYQYGKEIGQALTRGINAAQGTVLGFSFFGENLKEDAEDYGASMAKLMSWSMQEQMSSIEDSAMLNYRKMGKYAKQYFDSIKDGQRANESDYEWTKRRATALVMISKLEGDIVGKNKELQRALRSLVTDSIELGHETKSLFDRLAEGAGGLENLRKAAKENPIEMSAQIKTEVDKLDFDPASKQFIINDLYAMLNLRVNYVESNGEDPKKELDGWAKRVKEAVDAVNEEIKRNSKDIKDTDLFPVPQVGQTKAAYLNNAKAVIGIAKMTYDELQQIEDQELIDRTNALSPFVATFEKILNLYKAPKETGGNKDTFTPMLRTVKEIYQEFKKLQGSFDDLTAKEGALAKFGDAFKEAFGKTPEQMGFDLFSEEGVKAAYDYLISKAPDAKKKIQAQLAKGEIVWDVKLQTKKDADQQLLDDIQDMFDQYDLSLELKKLNIPPDLAKSLFDVDYLDLDGLKKAVQDQEAKFIGTDMEDEYKKFLEKIDDMEDKAAKERMKTYVEYARSAIGERAKIKLEELKKLKEIEETFAEKEGDSEETKKYKREQKQLASEKAQKESSDAMQKLEWEDFQKSDMFINIFEDLDGASDALLNHMIQKLQEFKSEWTDMPLEDMKKIVDKINELQIALVENNPWEAYKKSKEAVKDAMKGATFESEDAKTTFGDGKSQSAFMQALQLENVYQEQKKLNAQEELGYLETALRIKEGQATEEEKILEKQEDYNKYLRMSPSELKKQISAQKTIVKNAEDILSANEETLTESQKQAKALLKQADNLGKAQQMANDLYDAFSGLAEALGADSDSPAAIFADMGMNMLNTVLNTIQLQIQLNAATVAANGLGIAMNTAMGVVGWIVMAIQLVVQAITAIVNYADKQKEKEIERLAKRVEDLREKFEDLSEAIDEAWSTSQLTTYKNELDQTYKMAIAAQKAIVAARADEKKVRNGKTDSEEYKQWEEAKKELEELEQEYADITQDIYDKVTDGILDSVHDAAREFTDAWWDAFIEIGDGLSGLEENFNEMFLNLAKNQAAMQITGAFAERWKKDLEKYINADDTELTKDEAKEWAEKVRRTFPQLSAALEGYLGAFKDMATAEGAGLSGLQKGIQGITEDQADILAAYWNSVRGYTASIDSKMDLVLANLGAGGEDNPMLEQMRLVAKNTSAINTLLNSLVKGGHPQGGQGLKVFMD